MTYLEIVNTLLKAFNVESLNMTPVEIVETYCKIMSILYAKQVKWDDAVIVTDSFCFFWSNGYGICDDNEVLIFTEWQDDPRFSEALDYLAFKKLAR